ncbi:MAG: sigma-70 family RNA polymerase sigma factor [Acidobacteria bacterium]|nr:sigma-70 family RNA polymerase sigma factor [Acidobacteriota bacterium]
MSGFGHNSGAAWETEELFAEHRDSLMRYLRRHLDDQSVAEDILQECFIRFFQTRSRGEEIDQPRAWLFRVSHNLLIDHGRKSRPDLLDEEGWERLEGQMAGGNQGLEARLQLSSLPWDRLTELELECLRLRSEGLKFREVGEVLGLTISTVASYIARAVKKLQEPEKREAPERGRTATTR